MFKHFEYSNDITIMTMTPRLHDALVTQTGVSASVADDMLCYLRDLLSTLMSTVTVFERAAEIILSLNGKIEARLLPALCECYVDTQVVLQNNCSDMDLWMEVGGLLLQLTRHLVHHSACGGGKVAVDRDVMAVTLQSLLARDEANTVDPSDFLSAVVIAHEHWQKSQVSHQNIVRTALSSSTGTPKAKTDTTNPKQQQIRLLITQVQQVLPDLGEGFVAAVLSARGNDVQATIGTLLDGELPEAARGIPKNASLAEYTRQQRGGASKQHKPGHNCDVGYRGKDEAGVKGKRVTY